VSTSSFIPHPSSFLPYGKQSIDEHDIAAVLGVLSGDWLTCGPKVDEFEQALAGYCGAKHAIAVSNGTAALHLAALAAQLRPGDRLLTSAITFLASANCAEYVGATADFADIDPTNRCVSEETLAKAWRDDVKAVVAVDFAGYPCVTRELAAFVHDRGAVLIEDGCHAIGASLQGHKIGGLPWADMTTFSFHPVKTITTGEGGAILTNRDDLAERCRLLRNHGMVKAKDEGGRMKDEGAAFIGEGPWVYEMPEPGFNYRLTDLQCALGLSQLKKLDRFVRRRREIVDRYNIAFQTLPGVQLPPSSFIPHPSSLLPAWHLYVLEIDFDALGKSRAQVMTELKGKGVGTQVHYIPVHLQPYYRTHRGYREGKCPAAEAYYRRCLSLPLYPSMSERDVETVVQAVRKVLKSA